jgi:hypothetical protein
MSTLRTPVILLLAALMGCSSALPTPKTGPHHGDDPLPVPSQPPPGKVELISAPPATLKSPVWVDGEWLWKGHRWAWQDGRWEEAHPGMYFAPTKTVRLGDGTLVHFAGTWKLLDGSSPPPAPAPAPKPAAVDSPPPTTAPSATPVPSPKPAVVDSPPPASAPKPPVQPVQ